MAKREVKPLPFRIFVGGRPYEDLTQEERSEFSRKIVDRMGRTLNDYYNRHPEEYKKL